MKRFLVAILLLLTIGCSQSQPENTLATSTPVIVVAQPEIELNETRGGPNTIVDVRGTGFPSETWVVVRLGITPTNLSQSYAQVLTTVAGTFEANMMMPTAWEGADLTGQTELIVVAETADQALRANANFTLEYDGAFKTYENTDIGFAVDIPQDWVVTEPQTTPLGEMFLLGLGEPTSGNPAVSTILIADSTQIRPAEAVNLLQCGTLTCQERVTLGITQISGLDARQAIIGTDQTPKLEWFFINYNGRLIYFSLHDPTTLQTLEPLIDTFRLIEQTDVTELAAAPTEPAEPTETAEPTDTPEPVEEPTDEVVSADEALTETAVPTETATLEPTETNTATPAATNTATATSTSTNTPTATATNTPETPTETPAPTATPPDPYEAGPVQTVINLLEIILAQNVTIETIDYFSEEQRETITTAAAVQSSLELGFNPTRFAVSRLQETAGVVVSVELTNPAGISAVREFSMIVEQDRWRVDQIELVEAETETETETEAEETPEATTEATTEETPEATVTTESEDE